MAARAVVSAREALEVARALADAFARTAAERDAAGGTPLAERRQLRESGLLPLAVPLEYGGGGAAWTETLQVVRTLAAADPSLAHVLGYHYLGLATPRLIGTPEQQARAYRETVAENLFWGNALNPLDARTVVADGVLVGTKSFCSGSADSDRLLVSARDGERLLVAVVPTRRAGVEVLDDWDNMGQRQTDSGTVAFRGVRLEADEVLGPPGPGATPLATLRTPLVQLILAEVYLGIADGALAAARAYTLGETRAWPQAGVARAADDPLVQHAYGELWLERRAAAGLTEQAEAALDGAWARGEALTAEQRGEVAVAVAAARVAAGRLSVAAGSRMFELMGARATAARLRYDRFWRNARTLTLHDPLDHKLRELGAYALDGAHPTPGFYS